MDDHVRTYVEEAIELLNDLEATVLELEENPNDRELIARAFRALHTIKGSGSMFGFDSVARFTHGVETVFDEIRAGRLSVTGELISLTLEAKDLIRRLLAGNAADDMVSREVEMLLASFHALAKTGSDAAIPIQKDVASAADEEDCGSRRRTFRIRFIPAPGIFMTGTNPQLLLAELRTLGQCRIFAGLDDVPTLDQIDPEKCYVWWDIVLTTDQGMNAIQDVFIFIDDSSKVDITLIDEEILLGCAGDEKKIGEILIDRQEIDSSDLTRTLTEKKKIGELLVEKGLVSREKVESALVEQAHLRDVRKAAKPREEASSIRVPADKLDVLVNLVGEMVSVQAHLSQVASHFDSPELSAIAEEVERLTADLRDNTLNMRMLPIGTTFGRFRRLVRDLSRDLGKEVEMTTEGAETELDKTVIDRLNDPLVHLIRNSMDHGIEAPAIRESHGKPRMGKLHIAARHSGAYVHIEIKDDGAGIDPAVIRRKAIEKGLISPEAELGEKETLALIFAPGFSTSETISGVSGRGVGMDVVKKTIDNLRGSIDISSIPDIGTTVTLKLPLTLAIIEGLLVEINRQSFILPLTVVQECVELTRKDVEASHGRDIASIRGEIIPYIRLRQSFGIAGARPDTEQIVITELQSNRIGLVVDKVVGEHQTVIKSLGKVYRNVEGISGATILGNGTVALIMDVARLTNDAYS